MPPQEVPPVWTYWEGRQPPWIQLCLRTIGRNIPGVQVLRPQCFRRMYDNAHVPWPVIKRQRPNVKSDFIRAWLLHTIGGIWIDADAIVFRDVRPIWELLAPGEEGADFVSYRRAGGMLCSALIAARADSAIAAAYYETMVERLQANPGRLGRQALGPTILGRVHRTMPDVPIACIPPSLVHQIHKRRWGRAPRLARRADAWQPPDDAFTCMLTHRALGPLKTWSRRRLLRSNTVVGACFRKALGGDHREGEAPAEPLSPMGLTARQEPRPPDHD